MGAAAEIAAMIEERIALLASSMVQRGLVDDEGQLTVEPGHPDHRGACQVIGGMLALDELLSAIRGDRPDGATIH